ncbi:MAG: hypothetical protein JSU82_02425 [Rhodospirillales bacterium]|nr:MAG: hypothetical protein JSU82_02425 [Rhodospirillales bacterium]
MPGRIHCTVSVFAVVAFAAVSLLAVGPVAAQSLMSEAAARQALEAEYGVEVLRVEAGERDGVPVFFARVMNPAGNFNEAFQVNILVVDRRSGRLVRQFRHDNSGVQDTAGTRRDTNENSGPILRRESVQ